MQIIDRLPLSRDKYLCIAKIGKKTILLGIAPNSIRVLAEFNGDEFTPEEANQGNPNRNIFMNYFASRMKEYGFVFRYFIK